MAIRVHLPSLQGMWRTARRGRTRDSAATPGAIWDLEPGSPEFAAEMRRQVHAANESPHAEEDLAFIESISVFPGK